ncbi:hypothetical protein BD309DRAFT_1083464 [Dichomitus squalens]|nr:hypothetical protein BD309DRAFT_1083464 [Dichomitus squalens]
MDWTLSHSETLQVLKSMGIEIPTDTKLSGDALEKRLRDALNAAQYKDRLPSPFDLHGLPAWPLKRPNEADTRARSLFEAVQRGNMQEALQVYETKKAGGSTVPTLYVDPFMDLRQTMMGLGKYLDDGLRWCVLQDQEKEHCAVNLRVLSVLEVNERTPAFVVLYRNFDKSTALEGIDWIDEQVDTNPSEVGEVMLNVNATPLEQRLLLRVLKLNASLVPSDFKVERRRTEQSFKVSVLLPVGPLEYDALARLNVNLGCAVCGKRATSRCAGCQSIAYCGSECQRSDWPDHKITCRSLKGGTWLTIRLRSSMPGQDGKWLGFINRHTSTSLGFEGSATQRSIRKLDGSNPPPNTYDDKPFLVKFQVALVLAGLPAHMMMYDRKRTFQAFFYLEDDAWVYADFVREMEGPRGGYGGIKMYRWAKRVSEWELSVCLDREPGTDTKW